jgi:hypothetical protein
MYSTRFLQLIGTVGYYVQHVKYIDRGLPMKTKSFIHATILERIYAANSAHPTAPNLPNFRDFGIIQVLSLLEGYRSLTE